MRKTLAASVAALTFGGAVAAAALPAVANAHEWRGYYGDWDHHHHRNNAAGAAIVAGIAGLAIGAALANNHPRYDYNRSYYDYNRSYYAYPSYRYDNEDYDDDYVYRPAVCASRHWTWDPYIGRRVLVTSRYAC